VSLSALCRVRTRSFNHAPNQDAITCTPCRPHRTTPPAHNLPTSTNTNTNTKANPTRRRLFGFLAGATSAGAAMYYYVIDEYRVSNQLLTEDIYALQSAVQRIEGYVRELEGKVEGKKGR
jgi:hypothetical protein